MARRVIDWLFRDRRTGRLVVAQFPNLPLWILLATVVGRRLVDDGSTVHDILRGIGLAALAWWAVDELVRGVNPWRRLLGIGGLVLVVLGLASWLTG